MSAYNSYSVQDLIDDVTSGKLILPAMQRNFVWSEEKIADLFDSLLRGYPMGTFLFWQVDEDDLKELAFNEFLSVKDDKQIHYGLNRGARSYPTGRHEYLAVLDGQQRITSLYIGLKGYVNKHISGKKWDDPSSYEKLFLCIDAFVEFKKNSKGSPEAVGYSFKFQPERNIEELITDETGKEHFWVKVATVFEQDFDGRDYVYLVEKKVPSLTQNTDQRRVMGNTLDELATKLTRHPNMTYFVAKCKELSKIVDIFVRVNSGGQKLSACDLMMSVASVSQGGIDIHKKMQQAIKTIEEATENFKVEKEFILTAGLLLTSSKSLSLAKRDNYKPEKVDEIFIDNWEAIISSICNTFKFVDHIGISGDKLKSKNILLPIVYYFFKNKLTESFCHSSSKRAQCDRIFIRQWILRSIINEVFHEGIPATLLALRKVLDRATKNYFPLDDLLEKQVKKPLNISNDQLDELLDIEHGDVKIVPILRELTKNQDTSIDVDHLWPKSRLQNANEVKKNLAECSNYDIDKTKINFYIQNKDKLPNLQLLNSVVNKEKQAVPFDQWIQRNYPDEQSKELYCDINSIPKGISYRYDNFEEFIAIRKKLLKIRLRQAFPLTFEELVTRYSLEKAIE